jgi:predicted GNAT family acetyltransferase
MGPSVVRWSNVHEFFGAAEAFLAAREAEHCLLFGIAATLRNHPAIYPDPRLWTVADGGRVVAVALRTPPHSIVLSQIDEARWIDALTAELLATDELPGVLGPPEPASAVVAAWSARTGRAPVAVVHERIFRLDQVIAPPPAPGRCRALGAADRATLEAWLTAFHREATPGMPPPDAAAFADRYLGRVDRVGFVWELAGEIVALAGVSGPTPRGIRIGPVYTPPERRGHGYASNLVAAVSALQLQSGRRFCFLFTNLANPTSNRIYQAIGYRAVTDVDQYQFG